MATATTSLTELTLWDQALVRVDSALPLTPRERFEQFHRDNPQVFQALKRLALELKRKGHERYSIKGLFEVLRWDRAMRTSADDFKLNNNYHARYARKLMAEVPDLEGFFETRGHRHV